jgi:hypothetical protein
MPAAAEKPIPFDFGTRFLNMRPRPLAALLVLSAARLFGDTFSLHTDQIPSRPGIPVAYVDGKRQMIVGFRGNTPVVLVDGARVTARDARMSIIPGQAFAPGYVNVDNGNSTQWKKTYNIYGDVRKENYTTFDGTFTADRDYKDVYLLLLEFEDVGGIFAEAPKVAILGSEVGQLEAGKKKTVHSSYPELVSDKQLHWVALVFDAGVQIHCSTDANLLDGLFDALDHVALQKVIAQRSSGDYPIMVFRQFPMAFEDGVKAAFAGRTVRMRLHVAPSGLLDFVDTDENGCGDLIGEMVVQMHYWLFLPRIKDGQPQEGVVVLPIKF